MIEYLGWPSFQIDASSVASPYIHETSRKVSEMFERAMQNAPSVLVIDEMEAFLADRETGSGVSHHRVEEVAEFLRRIPEAAKNEVLIVAMTNRMEMIDPAIMRRGRFDHVIKVDYADKDEVLALLGKLLATLPNDGTVALEPLSRKLAGRPLSDVTFVVREGARLAVRAGATSSDKSSCSRRWTRPRREPRKVPAGTSVSSKGRNACRTCPRFRAAFCPRPPHWTRVIPSYPTIFAYSKHGTQR